MIVRASPIAGRLAWSLYDWATSPFAAVIITFIFATYFSQAVAADPIEGTALWGWAMTASALIGALLSPVLGAIADAGGPRKPWIFAFTVLAVATTSLLWLVAPDPSFALLALVLVALASLGVELAGVFYNAMLPDLEDDVRLGRLSGWAWGAGYVGGLACLVLVLTVFVQSESPPFGLDKDEAEHVRITGPLVAAWLALFSLPLFALTPDRRALGRSFSRAIGQGLSDLASTFRHVRRHRLIVRFLIARMFYVDGLNTLFAFGGIYAAETFGMELAEVIQFGILLNLTAGVGAIGFGWVDDWIGPKRTILIALFGLILCGLTAVLAQSVTTLWFAGGVLGLFVGPAQAASRTLMARLSPAAHMSEMFGLYNFSGRVTSFFGPFILATVTYWSGSQRLGMATILLLFLAGMVILWRLDVTRTEMSPPEQQLQASSAGG